MRRRFPLLLLGLLVACGSPTPAVIPALNSVLPNPAQPGSSVVLYGTFPAQVQAQLDGQPLQTVGSEDTLRFTLPEDTLAGSHALTVSGTPLSTQLSVRPRLDRVTLIGGTLHLTGAGWLKAGKLAGSARVSVDTSVQTPGQDGVDLTVPLADSLLNGALNVAVSVNGASSDAVRFVKEAATLSGSVELPAAAQALSAQAVPSARAPQPGPDLVVHHSGTLPVLSGLRAQRQLPGVTKLHFDTEAEARASLKQLQDLPGVTGVAYDASVSVDGAQTEATRLTAQGTSALGTQWFWPLMGLPATWTHTRGAGVTVAVVDTGVALDHPDLKANLLPGHNFVEDGTPPADTVGHGTHVAGLIAANGQVSGAAPEAHILPVRVLSDTSGGSAFTVAQGVLWAAGLLPDQPNPHPADIINLSLGTTEASDVLQSAIAQAQQAGVLVVAATGNNSGVVNYPAAFPGVLAVTAVSGPTLTYQPGYADHGPGTRITAYGGDMAADQNADGVPDGILSTDLVNRQPGYGLRNGTSMAAPQVAGIAALALSSGIARAQLAPFLLNTATDLGPLGEDALFGRGLVNARVATVRTPKTYVVALDASGHGLAWTPVDADFSFTLTNVPLNAVRVVAATDENGNGLLGEAGELSSVALQVNVQAGLQQHLAPLRLNPSAGRNPLSLP